MKKNIEAETKFYQLLAYAAMVAEITMILGFFMAFAAILHFAGFF